jgi:hypothetical protein
MNKEVSGTHTQWRNANNAFFLTRAMAVIIYLLRNKSFYNLIYK